MAAPIPYDAIVLGLGAMGAAACGDLAGRGARVLGLDRFGSPHAMGSSHGDTRLIRLCYYEHPDYVPLLRRAYDRWAALEAASGRDLLRVTGGLYAGPPEAPGNELVQGSLRAARAYDLPHEVLDPAERRARYPQVTLPEAYESMFEPNAGILFAERCIATQIELALRHGAEVHGVERAVGWSSEDDAVVVRTDRAAYRARRLVVCAGAWTESLLHDLGVELAVTRQVLGWVWPREPEAFTLGRLPIWGINTPRNTLYYGFPILPDGVGVPGFKLAHHRRAEPADPETVDRVARREDEAEFRPCLERFMPGADGELLALRVCLYTSTPDAHFVLDRHPRDERVCLAAGFSGHGFKFAPVVGEALADLALEGGTALPIGFLGLERFGAAAG